MTKKDFLKGKYSIKVTNNNQLAMIVWYYIKAGIPFGYYLYPTSVYIYRNKLVFFDHKKDITYSTWRELK